MLNKLNEFISIRTLAGDKSSNEKGIAFIIDILKEVGFTINIEGNSPYFQPSIVAKYNSSTSDKKVVLYSHYDVEKVNYSKKWITKDPFVLEEINGRLYGRGIADNKGTFIARLFAIKEMLLDNVSVPSILWLIQGEEEVGGLVPFEVFPKYVEEFKSKIYVEETGYHKHNNQLLFFLSKNKALFLDSLNKIVFNNNAKIEYRELTKFLIAGKCPFTEIIPTNSYYIGFGPNDEYSSIHQENESLNKELLLRHISQFKVFLDWINKSEI